MISDFITWLCRSPRRLVVVTLSTIILVFVLGSALLGNDAPSDGGDAPRAATGSTSAVVPASDGYVTAAVDFVTLWAKTEPNETKSDWLARLTPLATPDYASALETTDPSALPGAAPDGEPVVRFWPRSRP